MIVIKIFVIREYKMHESIVKYWVDPQVTRETTVNPDFNKTDQNTKRELNKEHKHMMSANSFVYNANH